jgi:N-acetylglucosamine-6-sulfatase
MSEREGHILIALPASPLEAIWTLFLLFFRVVFQTGLAGWRMSDRGKSMTITRRELLAGAAGSAAAFAGAKPAVVRGAAVPSIVMIVTDDMRADDWEVLPRTRALLADAGTTFPNFILTTPQCGPSRATIFTGRYAHSTGISGNRGTYTIFHDSGLEADSVAVWLQSAGYRTVLVGKYLNGYEDEANGAVPTGWTDWHGVAEGQVAYDDFSISDNGTLTRFRRGDKEKVYSTDVFTERALSVISGTAPEQPLFLMLNMAAPHTPSIPADRHADLFPDAAVPRTDAFNETDVADKPLYIRAIDPLTPDLIAEMDVKRRKRWQALQAVDEAVERVVAMLAMKGRLDSTVILFLSDNGYLLGEHRLNGKQVPYEESIRVPLVVRGPGFDAGVICEDLVGNLDLAPTLAAIAKLDVPETVDGRPLPMTHTDPSPPRQAIMIEDLKIGEAGYWYHALRTPSLLYVEYYTGERELYDLTLDPMQLTNLAGNPAVGETVAALSVRLAALAECRGTTCRAAADEPLRLPGWPL